MSAKLGTETLRQDRNGASMTIGCDGHLFHPCQDINDYGYVFDNIYWKIHSLPPMTKFQ